MANKYLLFSLALGICAGAFGAVENEGPIKQDWTATIDMAEGDASCEDGQLIPTADGKCVGVYTTGANGDIYEGRVLKMDMQGKTLWQQSIQAATQTTAQRVIEGPNGCIFVTGTTLQDNITKPYVAKFSADGQADGLFVIDNGNSELMIGNFEALTSGFTLFFSARNTSTLAGQYTYKYYGYDLEEKASSTYAPSGSISVPISVVSNDNALVTVIESGPYTDGQLIIFPLESSDAPKTRSGSYKCGAADTEDFYFVLESGGGYTVERCFYANGYLNTKWISQTIEFDTNYYSPVVEPCDDGNVYMWHKSYAAHRVAKLSGEDGAVIWTNNGFAIQDTAVCEGFAYTLGVASNGDFVAGGHTGDFLVFWYTLAADSGNLVSYCADVIDNNYSYAYSYEGMSSFSNDTFYFAGYLRSEDLTAGYSPFFAAFDIKDSEKQLWHVMADKGYVPCDYTGSGAIADDGSAFAAITISGAPALAKYDADGKLAWYTKCDGIAGQGNFVHINDDNTVTLVGISESTGDDYGTNYSFIVNFDQEGNILSTTIADQGAMYPSMLNAQWQADGAIYILSSGYNSFWMPIILVQKANPDGTFTYSELSSMNFMQPYAGTIDQNGDVLAYGMSYDADSNMVGCILKGTTDGTVIYDLPMTAIDGCLYGAWSDTAGRTYVCGGAGYNAYYAIIDADGNIIEEKICDDLGFYETIVGKDDQPYLCGTVTPAGTMTIVGRVMALASDGSLTPAWTCDIDSPTQYTYAYRAALNDEGIVVAGWETNGTQVKEMVAAVSLNGEVTAKSVGEAKNNLRDDYGISCLAVNGKRSFVLSSQSLANLVCVGYASMYTIDGVDSLTEVRNFDSDVIQVVYYDLQGRKVANPDRGIYVRVRTLSNGSAVSDKIVK